MGGSPTHYYDELWWEYSLLYQGYSYSIRTTINVGSFTYYKGTQYYAGYYSIGRDPTIIVASAGVYTVSGSSQSILKDNIIVPAAGAIDVTGTAASVLWNHVLSAATEAVVIGGVSQSLLWNHVIDPTSGEIVIAGKDAYPSRFNAHLDIEAGSMVVAGQAASLYYTSEVVYVDLTIISWKMKKTANNTYTLQECSDVVRSNTGL